MTKETRIGVVAQNTGEFRLLVYQNIDHDLRASPSLNSKKITFVDNFEEKITYIHITSLDDIIGVSFNNILLSEYIAH